MSETKFTPGPWRAIDRRPVTGDWATRIPFAIERVSETHCAVAPIADVCDQPNAEANANLSAAAPEMYAALADAVRWLDALAEQIGYAAFLDNMPNNCAGRTEMKAVLARARGEEPQK